MSTDLPRRHFLAQLATGAAAFGLTCPVLAQTPSAAPTTVPESPDVARLRRQLESQREGYLRLLTAVYRKSGAPVAEAVSDYVVNRSKEQYSKRKIAGLRNLRALKTELWDKLPRDFQWEVLDESPEKMTFKVHKCPTAVDMKKLGVPPELGYALNCASDPGIAAGINPEIKFSRTQTLMQGHPCCDHCYELKAASV